MNPVAPIAPFAHDGRAGPIIRLSLLNLLFNLLTLSLWRFWGKTRVRRTLWSNTTAWGDPAEYTGTGRELFVGFLIVLVVIFLPISVGFGVAQAAVAAGHEWAVGVILLLQIGIAVLAAAGLYRARRYQLSRTIWRGIRAGQGGKALTYGMMFLGVSVASMLSLGWAAPWAELELACYRMDNTTFGDARFRCDARPGPLYKRFAVVWVCGLIFLVGVSVMLGSMGIYTETAANPAPTIAGAVAAALALALVLVALPMAWYRAAFLRHLAAHTRFDGIACSLEATSGKLLKLALGNWLISVLSLGILRPWAAQRTFRFACEHLRMAAEPDWSRVHQGEAAILRSGEGLSAVFDGAGDF